MASEPSRTPASASSGVASTGEGAGERPADPNTAVDHVDVAPGDGGAPRRGPVEPHEHPLAQELQRGPRPEPDEPVSPPDRGSRRRRVARGVLKQVAEIPMLVLFAFVIAVVIKTFLVQAFFIPSGSMLPTLHRGDRVLVEKISYRLHPPRRGDVVVFEKSVFNDPPDVPWPQDVRNFVRELLGLPTGEAQDYIKRIVAASGDTIEYSGTPRRLIVNGEEVDISYVKGGRDRSSSTVTDKDCRRLSMEVAGDGCRVPAGRVFVMGDNRANSEDSRFLGPIDEDKIVGRAFAIIWPPADFGGL